MKSRFYVIVGFLVCAVFLLVGMGFCQDEGKVTREQWTQKVNEEWEKNKGASDIISMEGNGIIDYEKGYIEVMSLGAAKTQDKNLNQAQLRLGCFRAAEVLGYRAILETTRGVQIDSETVVKDFVTDSDMVKVKAEGSLRGAQKVPNSEDYFSDGSCGLKMRMPLMKAVQTLGQKTNRQKEIDKAIIGDARPKIKPIPEDQVSADTYTGLVVNARGLGIRPAMSPKIVDENNKEIYGTMLVSREYAIQQGISGYASDLTAAQANPRVTSNPLTVAAIEAVGAAKSDIKIKNEDAAKLTGAKGNIAFMQKCRVMIVLD